MCIALPSSLAPGTRVGAASAGATPARAWSRKERRRAWYYCGIVLVTISWGCPEEDDKIIYERPGWIVSGAVDVDPAVVVADYRTLYVRAVGSSDCPAPADIVDWLSQVDGRGLDYWKALDSITFPHQFEMSAGLGWDESQARGCLVGWLTNESSTTFPPAPPAAVEPRALQPFDLQCCYDACRDSPPLSYCGRATVERG